MPASASSLIHAVAPQLGALELPDPVAELPGLLAVLKGVVDPRARRGVRHQLVSILAVSICAVTAGACSLVAIAEWAADLVGAENTVTLCDLHILVDQAAESVSSERPDDRPGARRSAALGWALMQ